MTNAPFPLTPDDEAQDIVHLGEETDKANTPPYETSALLIGLVGTLLMRMVAPYIPLLTRLNTWPATMVMLDVGIGVAMIAYIAMLLTRKALPLLPTAGLSAVLGMLYGLPVQMVIFPWHGHLDRLGLLGLLLIAAYILGLLTAVSFNIKARPNQVLAIAFLLPFVIASLISLFIR